MDERFCFCPLITFCRIDFHLLRYYGQNMENMPKLPDQIREQGSRPLCLSAPFAAFFPTGTIIHAEIPIPRMLKFARKNS
jgi:hypothetical protein